MTKNSKLDCNSYLRSFLLFVGLFVASIFGQSVVQAATFIINCDEGSDLQATINAAAPGDAIVAQGTCIGIFNIGIDLSLFGFLSVTLDSDGGAQETLTIEDGATVVIENAVIRGSRDPGLLAYQGANVTLRNVEVVDNEPTPGPITYGSGGGIRLGTGSFMLIEDSWIHGNRARAVGGGISNKGWLTVRNSAIESNRSGLGVGGAGIYNGVDGWIEVSDTVIYDNRSELGYSGLVNYGLATLIRTSIVDNRGGISNSGILVANGSTITGNVMGYQGGKGGGLINREDGVAFLTNSTLAENGATQGGGIYNLGDLTLWETTVSDNIAYSQNVSVWPPGGSGLWNDGVASVKSSIISGNDKYPWGDCDGSAPLDSNGGNVLGLDCQVFGPIQDIFVADPKLDTIGPNGGPTDTMAPLRGSPIVDAGSCINPTDQRGVIRPQGTGCDTGSYENRLPTQPGSPMLFGGLTSPNMGSFSLSWSPASDPDGDQVLYLLERKDADDPAWASVGYPRSGTSRNLSLSTEGTQRFRAVATDGNNSGLPSTASSPIVVDLTAPAQPMITSDRPAEYIDTSSGLLWFLDNVHVTITPGVDPPLADGSPGSGTVTAPWSVTYNTDGAHSTSAKSTDAAGNSSVENVLTVNVDATDPSVSFNECPTSVFLDSSVDIPWSASDFESGLNGSPSGYELVGTTVLGPTTTTVVVSDNVGHHASDDCLSQVIFDFGGFAPPLAAQDEMIELRAGKEFRVAFSINGFHGDEVIVGGSVVWTPISCATGTDLGGPGAANVVKTAFYKERFDQYWFIVDVEKERRRTCARFELTLIDGVTHGMDVAFK